MEPLRETDDTFCVAVFGDFLGAAPAEPGHRDLSWTPRRATPDTVFKLLGWKPTLRLPGGDPDRPITVELGEMEGLGPQALYQRLDLFAPYREARAAAQAGKPLPSWLTGEEAAAPSGGGGEPTRPGTGASSSGSPEGAEGHGLLDAILDVAQPPSADALPQTREELDEFVRAVVRPHLVRPDTQGPARVAAVDEAASELMSALLHTPRFQALEGLWRSLVFLLSRVDTSGKVRVYAVQASREELAADLAGESGAAGSRLQEILTRPDLGAPARRWSLAVGAYSFGANSDDLELLTGIGAAAATAGVPWISSFEAGSEGPAPPEWPGLGSPAWATFRHRPEAAWVGLTWPRFLVREPFASSRPTQKGFAFRETVTSPDHLLWGHGAFLCAVLLAQGYAARGRSFLPEEPPELGGMPQTTLPEEEGGAPSSTSWTLDLPGANRLMEAGVIPLIPFPSRAAVSLGRVRPVGATEGALDAW